MRLQLKINDVDYTDYIESIRFANHADGIVQSHAPVATMIVNLSTVLPDTVSPPQLVTWGVGEKYVAMAIVKVTRGKGTTEVRAQRSETSLSGFVKGCVLVNDQWRDLISEYKLKVKTGLVRTGYQVYANTPEDILLGMTTTTLKQAMIDNYFPAPWSSRSDLVLYPADTKIIRQIQTLEEFNARWATDVAKIEIDYEDVVQEEEVTSHVDPTSMSISKLNEKKTGVEFNYTSTTAWSDAFDDIRVYTCEPGNTYAVGVIRPAPSGQRNGTTELHMSDGTVKTVEGIVAGITPEWYYKSYTTDSAGHGLLQIIRFGDDAVLASLSHPNTVAGGWVRITNILSAHHEVVRVRQSLQVDVEPYDLILLGKPTTVASTITYVGLIYHKVNGTATLAVTTMSARSEMDGAWLLGTYQHDGKVNVRYGKQGHIMTFDILSNGTVDEDSYRHYASTDDSSVYPISAAKQSTLRLTGYTTTAPYYRNGAPQASPLLTPPIQWTSLTNDTAQLGWFLQNSGQVIYKTTGNHFGWRLRANLNEFASTDVSMRKSQVLAIVTPPVSVLLFGNGVQNEERTVVMEASSLPENTFALDQVKIPTGNSGEDANLSLPFVLQGGNQAWPLVPTDKTRLSVQVAAISVAAHRSQSIQMQSGGSSSGTASATGRIKAQYDDQPQPGHKYYIAVEVDDFLALTATKASFAWGTEAAQTSAHPIVLDLRHSGAVGRRKGWIRKSVVVQVPADFAQVVSRPGVYSEGASFAWTFRRPEIIDLTLKYGAGNEPDVTWCDNNLDLDDNDNMIAYSGLDNVVDGTTSAWALSNAGFTQTIVTDRLVIDDNDLVLPPVGSPVLYHREAVKYNFSLTAPSDWTSIKAYVHGLVNGAKYIVKFKYKVNTSYTVRPGYTHSTIPLQVLRTATGQEGSYEQYELGSAETSTEVMSGYKEGTIVFTARGANAVLRLAFGFAEPGQEIDISLSEVTFTRLGYTESELYQLGGTDYRNLDNWVASTSIASTLERTKLDVGEEGIVLGFDYDFQASAQLYIDILLLGQPKPWDGSVIG